VFDKVTIAYRGIKHEIGRGRDFYGIWLAGTPRSQPLERWPETAEGWSAAWARFASIETPGAIAPAGRGTPPVPQGAAPSAGATGPAGTAGTQDQPTGPLAGGTVPAGGYASPFGHDTGYGQPTGPLPASGTRYGPVFGGRIAPVLAGRAGSVAAAGLLAVGVILGIAGLFPSYLGTSLGSQASELIPHLIYLAAWALGAALVVLGGSRARIGALLAMGVSAVTFGLFVSDAGLAIDGGSSAGAGLVLSFVGWLVCAAGSTLAVLRRPVPGPAAMAGRPVARPSGAALGPAVLVVLAGLGVAAAFAPAWDTFTLRAATGQQESLTAGNAFANPGWVIAGNVLVMVAVAAVVIVAVLWRPVRHGAALLAGAAIVMVAQAISAIVQAGGPASPTQFGISPAQASRIGLTVSSGLTPAFWIYCAFLVALVVSCAWMLFTPHDVPAQPAAPAAWTWPASPADHSAGQPARDEADGEPEFVTAPPSARPRPGEHEV